jgi:thymidylate synthase
MKVLDIRNLFVDKYKNKEFVTDKTGIKTLDIVGINFEADEDHIFGDPNDEYIKRELEWYLSESLNVYDIKPKPPKIWELVSSKDGSINSNYGWCIFSEENGNQYNNVLNELRKNPESRRGAMIYNRPSIWKEYNTDGMSDFICTYSTQHLIRDNTLYYVVYMRSNDAWAGYRNDYAWHKFVSDKLSNDLEIENTKIIWNSGSLHLYERQFYLVEHFMKTKETHIDKKKYIEIYEK